MLQTAPDAKDVATSEQWASLSRDAYAAGQFERALAPTLELTKAYPQQHIYFERLAIIGSAGVLWLFPGEFRAGLDLPNLEDVPLLVRRDE